MAFTVCLFVSPMPTFKVIKNTGTVDQFSPTSYLTTLLNCLMWVIYGLNPYNREIIIVYGVGTVAEIIFLSVFFYYSPRNLRIKIVAVLVAEAVCTAIVLTGGFKPQKRTFAGIVCVISCVIMYSSPLCMMKTITETRDVKHLPFWVCFSNFVNGILGIISSLMSPDHYFLVANFLGVLLSISQLYLYFRYKDEPELEPHVDARRAAVDADRAALDADRAAVDADRAAVDADRAAVDADRVAVDADRAAVDADRAAVDADWAVVVTERAAVEAGRAAVEEGRADVFASRAIVDADRAVVLAGRAAVLADRAAVEADRAAVEAARRAAALASIRTAAVNAGEDADSRAAVTNADASRDN